MRLIGSHFVLGQTIEEALRARPRARANSATRSTCSAKARAPRPMPRNISGLCRRDRSHRRERRRRGAAGTVPASPSSCRRCIRAMRRSRASGCSTELTPRAHRTCAHGQSAHDLQFTVDAEEADRLELSLEIIGAVLADPSLRGWDGFGLAVQAYQKRALAVIGWIEETAAAAGRRLTVRLVKGAYWDTEIKRAQERGLADYPVFTPQGHDRPLLHGLREAAACGARPAFPQFATHNALTVASVIEDAGGVEGFEFQRLHGMGEALYEALLAELPARGLPGLRAGRRPPRSARLSGAAAAGERRQLVLRVGRRRSRACRSSKFCAGRRAGIADAQAARNPKIPLPRDLYLPERHNSAGIEFGDAREPRRAHRRSSRLRRRGVGRSRAARRRHRAAAASNAQCSRRSTAAPIGHRPRGRRGHRAAAMAAAAAGFSAWAATAARQRAAALERAADLLEQSRGALLALLQNEGGKTLDDALAEAARGCRLLPLLCGAGAHQPCAAADAGPDRRKQRAALSRPRRFRLHQSVEFSARDLSRPGRRRARRRQRRRRQAGRADAADCRARHKHSCTKPACRPRALHLVPGDGKVGASLVADPRVAGVAFTGSTEVGRAINRALAEKDGPIVPLIAETGGINAMIVDATALPEQVIDDVIASAFRSAGQRCSALRLLCLQDDVADRMLDMLDRRGARAQSRRSARGRDPCGAGDRRRGQGKSSIAGSPNMERAGRVCFRWDR